MTLAFFHQNQVSGIQGGIERYIDTLISCSESDCVFVGPCGEHSANGRIEFDLQPKFAVLMPRWLGFIVSVVLRIWAIRAFLARNAVSVVELSRPEYVVFSWMLPGIKVFTFHGTGPSRTEGLKYFIHCIFTWIVTVSGAQLKVIGRDPSALPSSVAKTYSRFFMLDAWCSKAFSFVSEFALDSSIEVFYAGRLAEMKNPQLLFNVIRLAKEKYGSKYRFTYAGSDEHLIPDDVKGVGLRSVGLLNPDGLARLIQNSHIGILCSRYGEGSPFIVVEALACGRCYLLPPLPGLVAAYNNVSGIEIASDFSPASFLAGLDRLCDRIQSKDLNASHVAAGVALRTEAVAARLEVRRLLALQGS